MGADVSTIARELAREIAAERSGVTSSSQSVSEQTRHGWDNSDKSLNITLDDAKVKVSACVNLFTFHCSNLRHIDVVFKLASHKNLCIDISKSEL